MDKKSFIWLFTHLLQYKKIFFLVLVSSIVLTITGIASPLLLRSIVDKALAGEVNKTYIHLFCIVLFVSSIPTVAVLRRKLSLQFEYKIKGILLQHLLRLDQAFYDDKGSTVILSELSKGTAALNTIVNMLCHGQLIISIPVAIFAAVYIAMQNVFAMFVVLLFGTIFFFCSYALGEHLQRRRAEWDSLDNKVNHRLREAVEQVTTIKVHGAEQSEYTLFDANRKKLIALGNSIYLIYGVFWFLGMFAHKLPMILVAYLFTPGLSEGTITAGTFWALLMYANKIVQPFTYLGELYSDYKDASARILPIIKVLEEKPAIANTENFLTLNPVQESIRLKRVSFTYPSAEVPILRDISFTIPAHKKTALVGRSGCGKTTLAKLLTRLRDPNSGIIEYDGTDLRNFDLGTLYKEIAYLKQEVPIFTGTIEDNVTLGICEYSEKDIRISLTNASADFVYDTPQGLATLIGERGKKLSRGERQRLALARIFMRNPSFIILDEATSSLDNKTERDLHDMFNTLTSLNGGRTILVIAHRLSTVRDADQIVVLDKGEIVDTGTHDELMSRCELYQELNADFI